MKHLIPNPRLLVLPLALAVVPLLSQAQSADRKTSIGLNVSALQYKGNYGSDYWNFSSNRYAPGLAINQYITKGLDLSLQGFYGELKGSQSASTYFATNLVNVNLGIKLKLNNGWALKEDAFIQPYLMAMPGWTYTSREGFYRGGRIDQDKSYFDIAAGAGINFRLGETVNLFVQTAQHAPSYANFDGDQTRDDNGWDDKFLQHTVGLNFNLGKAKDEDMDGVPDRKDKCPGTPTGVKVDENGCPIDTDKDGVADYQDQCPTEAGKPELQGCPDRDNDGVADKDDACPDTPGKPELKGCPDADNDGVIDQNDKCPNTPAGVKVDASGCPLDTDGDGVPDYQDRCPNRPGPASNRGCPEIKAEAKKRLQEATKYINFEFNKAVLLPSSYPTLDAIVQILNEYPDYTLSIAGHTDSKGSDPYNLRLSHDRAASARTYMLSKGIPDARIESRGYGETKPIADNATDAGRALNRRVDFDLYLTGDPNSAEVKYGPEPTMPDIVIPTTPAKKATPAKKPTTTKKAPVRKATPRR
ncbi:OmpA family protein [Hymenobacter jeollabukensis]|uniref:OmpA family protein n=1 Tax=Hymenobacter jeollabukensis TaxID=2025313 RepID=A0A5R8WQJ1_9BACT|nr:OmpA family protein [Hymenobacter jeollabukensis]TLM93024.1 OmpA family protein [Hymenobacter jeollabukensis]